jgi:hypothetical protein
MPLNMIFKMPIPPPVYWSFVHFLTMQIMPFPPYRAMWLDIGEFGMLYFIGVLCSILFRVKGCLLQCFF